jgi:ATP-dependent Lhr-like helicase
VPRAADLLVEPEEIEELLLGELGGSALFATHFRESAARALLLPRRRAGARTPLYAQRLRAQNLLAAARQHARFPIVLETYREVLQDVFDLPSLVELLSAVRRGEVEVAEVETQGPSPFARSLVFEWVAAYLYEGDAPLAERRAQALTLDRKLLGELLGQEELRELLDPEVLDELEAELQSLAEDRRARSADGLHDLLRRIGDLSPAEIRARAVEDPAPWQAALADSGRAFELELAGERRWVAAEDVARYRDALGAAPPPGVPREFLSPAPGALESLVARFARSHAPFAADAPAARFGLPAAAVAPVVRALINDGRLYEGELRRAGGREVCDAEVLRTLRRRTLARLRNQVAPVEPAAFARFLLRWHGVGSPRTGAHRLREILAQLEGVAVPFSELERALIPARMAEYQPRLLDDLGAAGEVVWIGRGALGSGDGRVALYRRDRVALLADPPEAAPPASSLHAAILEQLARRGASFFLELCAGCPGAAEDALLAALWELVWSGLVTNDTFSPLRALGAARRPVRARASPSAGGRWSLVSALRAGAPPPTEAAHARALALVERYGVVSREAAAAESLPGGFGAIAPVLRAMEDAGKLRRGYFVDGLTGAQYAHPGAVDRLRAARDAPDPGAVALSAIDPAQPWGALLPWPWLTEGDGDEAGRPRRAAQARVILARGVPIFFVERGGRRLRYFAEAGDDALTDAALTGLRQFAAQPRFRELRVESINGVPALRSPFARLFERAGFRVEPGGLVPPGGGR